MDSVYPRRGTTRGSASTKSWASSMCTTLLSPWFASALVAGINSRHWWRRCPGVHCTVFNTLKRLQCLPSPEDTGNSEKAPFTEVLC